MSAIGIIGIIIAICFASMVEIIAIITTVSRMIDQKMKTKTELELKVFEAEMNHFDKSVDKLIAAITSCVGNKKS